MQPEKYGKVSGNRRIDPNTVEEHEEDTDEQLHLWVEELANDKDFINDVTEEISIWKEKIAEAGCKPESLEIFCCGESHLDMAYKWRYEQTKKKAKRTLTKAIKHSKAVPDFRFAVSSPQIMAWMKEFYPDFYSEVKETIKKGSIEPVGGSWVEADCNMPSGEAFVRQRLHGMMFYRDEFGKLPEAEWYPDTFGYNAGLPQILAKSGAKYFLTSKMTWCATNDFPFTHFNWMSPDGSKVLVTSSRTGVNVFAQFPRYGIFRRLPKAGTKQVWNYDDEFADIVRSLDDTSWVKPVALFMGKGDGGHGPTHQEVGSMIAFTKACPKVGMHVKWSSVHDYFKSVAQYGSKLLTWKDELYLEYHQGTLTTHPAIKRWNRRLECLAQAAETIATIAHLANYSYVYPMPELSKGWKAVLLNQFHDVLPGSCIPEVLDDLVEIWEDTERLASGIIDEALACLVPASRDAIHVINPLSIPRMARVFIPVGALMKKTDTKKTTPLAEARFEADIGGKVVSYPCQPVIPEPESLADHRPAGWWLAIPMEPLGFVTGRLVLMDGSSEADLTNPVGVEAGKQPFIDNGITRVELDPRTGAIVKLSSKGVNGGRNLVSGDESGLTIGFDDDDSEYQAWNIKENYWDFPKNYPQDKDVSISVDGKGAVFAALRVEKTLGISKLCLTISLFKDDPTVHFFWHVNWQEKGVMLKVAFSTATGAVVSTSDQMYCATTRKIHPATAGDKARHEKVMQKYVDVSAPDNAWGIALLNEGKYGYDTMDGKLRLTMQKSALYPDTTSRTWAWMEREERKARDGTTVPTNVGIGPASCRFALFPHEGGALVSSAGIATGRVKEVAECYNNVPIVRSSPSGSTRSGKGKKSKDGATLEARILPISDLGFKTPPGLLVTALKMREWEPTDTVILRVAEIAGLRVDHGEITIPTALVPRIATIDEMDLLERRLDIPIKWNKEAGVLEARFAPFEVKTFGINIKRTKQ